MVCVSRLRSGPFRLLFISLMICVMLIIPGQAPQPAAAQSLVWCVSPRRVLTTQPCANERAYPSIQAALGSAQPGHEIRLADGIYLNGGPEVVTLTLPALTLSGGYSDTDWVTPGTADRTVLDGQGQRRVVRIEQASVRLHNLTIRGGVGPFDAYNGVGSGILAYNNQQELVILDRVILADNVSRTTGGGAAIYGPLIAIEVTALRNSAGENAGALWGPDITVIGGHYEANSSAGFAGAIYGATAIRDATFHANQSGRDGGAVVFYYSFFTSILEPVERYQIINSVFSANTSGEFGGAVLVDSTTPARPIDVHGVTFTANRARSGGGLHISNAEQPIMITDSRFIGNSASETAGALFVSSTTIQIERSIFEANRAEIEDGGALKAGGQLTLSEVVLADNVAGRDGGAIAQVSDQQLVIRESTLRNNQAGRSGGAITTIGSFELHYVRLLNNRAGLDGGGLHVSTEFAFSSQPALIRDSVISGNQAGQDGGGLHASSDLTMTASSIVANRSTGRGGGVYIGDLGNGTAALRASGVVFGNNRGAEADGIFIEGNGITLTNVTVASHAIAPNAAIVMRQGVIENPAINLVNTLVTSHTVGLERPRNAQLRGDYNAFFANNVDQRIEGAAVPLSWAHDRSANPQFMNAAANDFRLSADSPLVGQGDPNRNYSNMRDTEGQPIPMNGAAEVGGDELFRSISRLMLPLITR